MTRRKIWRWLLVTAVVAAWTFLAGSCAGVVAMSGAHSRSGQWPAGATIALVIVGMVWVLAPAIVWHRRRTRPQGSP